MSHRTYYRDWSKTAADGEAAGRQLKRMESCRSHYKMHCHRCDETIQKGDNITKVASSTGMDLRFRGCDVSDGVKPEETCFYMFNSGPNQWVHLECVACQDYLDKWKGNNVWTYWSAKRYSEEGSKM